MTGENINKYMRERERERAREREREFKKQRVFATSIRIDSKRYSTGSSICTPKLTKGQGKHRTYK